MNISANIIAPGNGALGWNAVYQDAVKGWVAPDVPYLVRPLPGVFEPWAQANEFSPPVQGFSVYREMVPLPTPSFFDSGSGNKFVLSAEVELLNPELSLSVEASIWIVLLNPSTGAVVSVGLATTPPLEWRNDFAGDLNFVPVGGNPSSIPAGSYAVAVSVALWTTGGSLFLSPSAEAEFRLASLTVGSQIGEAYFWAQKSNTFEQF